MATLLKGRAGAALLTAVTSLLLSALPVFAQPQPQERVTFAEAVQRAIERNPSAAIAAAGILRAEALLSQARAAAGPQITGNVTTTTLNNGVKFNDSVVTPRNSVTANVDARMPIYAPLRWARRTQAEDLKILADLDAAEIRRQTALATADAYLAIIARRRVVEAHERARDVARAHFDLATELEQRGTGSRLNVLRAQQEVSTDAGLVETSRLELYRAQEALGVLLTSNGPVDAADVPSFDVPPEVRQTETAAIVAPGFVMGRPDLRLFAARQEAAARIVGDSSKELRPTIDGVFQPQTTYPSPFFSTTHSWRLLFQASVPMYSGGLVGGLRAERQAALDSARASLSAAVATASSEIRMAHEAISTADRVLARAREAADQAQQVVDIVNVSFRAGAATNIEVLDAERRARDADTAVAVAEDALRRARFELLTAIGRFP